MAANEWDIILEEESEFELKVTYYSEDKTAKDISGYGAVFEVRTERKSNATSLIRAMHTNDISIAGTSGEIFVEIPESEVTAIRQNYPDFEVGAWDLLIFPDPNNPSVDSERLAQGQAYYEDAVATLP